MRIYKTEYAYHLVVVDDVTVSFTDFEKNSTGVELFKLGNYAGSLNFEAATEFYKAWRAM